MRGQDEQQGWVFSYVSAEERVPMDHPIRAIRRLTNEALEALSADFEKMYSNFGRPSIAPEKLLRAMLLQVLYTLRSERQLMEQMDYNLLYRWFVGLRMDEPVWDASSFSKNRQRLLEHAVCAKFFERVRQLAEAEKLLSEEHFSVDGTYWKRGPAARVFSLARSHRRRVLGGMESCRKTTRTPVPPIRMRGSIRRILQPSPSFAISVMW
jgi:transposase